MTVNYYWSHNKQAHQPQYTLLLSAYFFLPYTGISITRTLLHVDSPILDPAEVVKRRSKVVLAPKTVRTSTSHKMLLIVTLPIVMQSDSYRARDAVFTPTVSSRLCQVTEREVHPKVALVPRNSENINIAWTVIYRYIAYQDQVRLLPSSWCRKSILALKLSREKTSQSGTDTCKQWALNELWLIVIMNHSPMLTLFVTANHIDGGL